MSSQMNQNNLTVTVASAATSLLLLGMFYPNSSAARRRRRKMIENGELAEGSEYDYHDNLSDSGSESDHGENEKGMRSTLSSIASSSSLSLIDEMKVHEHKPTKEHNTMFFVDVDESAENSTSKHNVRSNENIDRSPHANNSSVDDDRRAHHGVEENRSYHSSHSHSHSHSHSAFQKENRTQSMSDDSEDSDISYGEDMLTHNFKHVRRGSINPLHAAAASDTDLSVTVVGSVWGDDSDETSSDVSSIGEPFPREENDCIYLDYNGTTPIHPMVLDAMVPYFTRHFGNPSSSHAYGLVPRAAVGKAKRAVLYLLHERRAGYSKHNTDSSNSSTNLNRRQHKTKGEESSIVFTGCGTEADNLAIKLALEFSTSSPVNSKKKHIITSNVEHPAINEALKALEAKGECEVTFVPVNEEGIVSAQDIVDAIRPNETILVTVMLANNECGALQPVREISVCCREHGILFHTDAAQAAGKVSLSLEDEEHRGIGSAVDMVTIVGHKMGAPKGVAALYIRPGCFDNLYETNSSSTRNDNDSLKVSNKNNEHSKTGMFTNNAGVLLVGGGQENGLRAGTENVPYIVGMGCAASLLISKTRSSKHTRWEKNALHMEAMRGRLLQNLIVALGEDNVRPNGPADASKRLPNTLSVGLKGVDSAEMLKKIQMHVACSAGSACHSQGGGVSPVLKAMNVPEIFARGTLRLSVAPSTSPEDVDKAARIIVEEARRQTFC